MGNTLKFQDSNIANDKSKNVIPTGNGLKRTPVMENTLKFQDSNIEKDISKNVIPTGKNGLKRTPVMENTFKFQDNNIVKEISKNMIPTGKNGLKRTPVMENTSKIAIIEKESENMTFSELEDDHTVVESKGLDSQDKAYMSHLAK